MNNEGGLQEAFDILPILKEESFLKAFPEERKARALLEFCAEGDVGAILDLVKGGEDEDDDFSMDGSDNAEGAAKPIDVLRYQDPTGSMDTGLHFLYGTAKRKLSGFSCFSPRVWSCTDSRPTLSRLLRH